MDDATIIKVVEPICYGVRKYSDKLVLLEEVVFLQGRQVNRSPTNWDALRNGNYQMPDQSSVETYAFDVQE